jgi:murein L,D-transpeptidase YcbB/YkuD
MNRIVAAVELATEAALGYLAEKTVSATSTPRVVVTSMGTMGRTACVIAVLLLCAGAAPSAARAADARPASPSLASTAELRKDPTLQALYVARNFTPLWTGSRQAESRRTAMLALLALESRVEPAGSDTTALAAAFAKGGKADGAQQAELRLTRAALAYFARRSGDPDVPTARAVRALARLDQATLTPPLALALTELGIVQDLGGWHPVGTLPGPAPTVPPFAVASPETDIVPAFPPRKRVPDIADLRRRLVQSADLPASLIAGEEMDEALVEAVRKFQKRHGLVVDGVVGVRTLAALNMPVAKQIGQVRVNLARRDEDRSHLARYVEVNVPGYELRLVERGKVTLRSRVIVGDEEKPTPIFDDRIRIIELNPSWYVPSSITPELLDKERKKPGYLTRNGFYWRASVEGGAADRLVQRPGPENALGRIKFLFPNHHSVYLHDTPQRGLFARSERSLSHGCIRVEKPIELALALLGREGWDATRLDTAFATEKTRRIELRETVPLFLDYRTAFVDDEGRLNLRPDLYGHDADGITAFKGKGLPPERRPEPESEPLDPVSAARDPIRSAGDPAAIPEPGLPVAQAEPPS